MDIRPVAASERNLGGMDFFLLWAGVAISLAEIWAGGLLAPMGLRAAVAAILLGHLLGNTVMALAGRIGSDHGIAAMVSIRPAFGILGSNLAAVLNVIQLVCWASIMLIIGGRAGAMLASSAGPTLAADEFWIVVIGAGTLVWAFLTGGRLWKWMQIVSVVGLVVVLLIMSWEAYRGFGSGGAVREPGPTLPFMTGLDLVIAMPISWMPLVSDYSRFARRSSTAFWSTWWSYFLVSSWMYLLGLFATLGSGNVEPHMQLLALLGGIGLVTPALLTVVFSTITSDFPDLYSATCSVLNISGRIRPGTVMVITGILSIALALVFPMERYQGFLFFIGAMFVPLFGIVLADYFLVRERRLDLEALDRVGGPYWYSNCYHRRALLCWAAGFAAYEAIQFLEWPVGGSIPSMLLAGGLYLIVPRAAPVSKPFSTV
jgi:putative hydroxymethylpyrimidine transporter CytX